MFKIVAGCYEQLVLGYEVISQKTTNEDLELSWKSAFTDHSQQGCIKCVASNDTFVATGSSDETICLYDLQLDQELGSLVGHRGAINQLVFPDKKHLISCSDDGDICVWEAAVDGSLLKTLKGHKGPVTSFAIHPSGKLGISASMKDGTLRTWNMIIGRSVYVKNFKKHQIEFVRWSKDGMHYITASQHFVQIYELDSAKCVHEFESGNAIMTVEVTQINNKAAVVFGDSGGNINIYSIPDGVCMCKYKAHENRVKSVYPFSPPPSCGQSKNGCWIASASSDGKIIVWKVNTLSVEEKTYEGYQILTIDTGARLTCVTVWCHTDDQIDDADPKEGAVTEEKTQIMSDQVLESTKKKKLRKRKNNEVADVDTFKKSLLTS
ncbi:unnamed protein product [Clavelina lepadiformis]|uniref:P21-activated protein kinase-interacting protein 1-like n=1 Tax=Clavelina lepadiformis TaxID=159417 RepID=A0ABP0F883_CLALP